METLQEITEIRETVAGYRGLYQGRLVEGSWAFAPGISWWDPNLKQWLVVGGYWQDGRLCDCPACN